jgi:hypothetical protein
MQIPENILLIIRQLVLFIVVLLYAFIIQWWRGERDMRVLRRRNVPGSSKRCNEIQLHIPIIKIGNERMENEVQLYFKPRQEA